MIGKQSLFTCQLDIVTIDEIQMTVNITGKLLEWDESPQWMNKRDMYAIIIHFELSMN